MSVYRFRFEVFRPIFVWFYGCRLFFYFIFTDEYFTSFTSKNLRKWPRIQNSRANPRFCNGFKTCFAKFCYESSFIFTHQCSGTAVLSFRSFIRLPSGRILGHILLLWRFFGFCFNFVSFSNCSNFQLGGGLLDIRYTLYIYSWAMALYFIHA